MKAYKIGCLSFFISMIIVSILHADMLNDEKWSFDFENVSIIDAFHEIKRITGMEIVVQQKISHPIMITYHNKNQSIIQLHHDLLKNLNHITSMNYASDGTLESIKIVIVGQSNGTQVKSKEKPNSMQTGMTAEQFKTDANLARIPSESIPTGMTKQMIMKNLLEKPPTPPKIEGAHSPPSPPTGY